MTRRKSIKTNYLYNLSYTLLNTALPLLTAPYLARVVGAEGVGVFAYNYAIAHFFYIFAKLGLNNYGTRQISSYRDSEKLSKVFSSIFYQQLITATFANVIYWVYVLLILQNTNKIYAAILGVLVFASFFDIDWLFSGLEQFKSISRKNIFVKTLSVFLIFLLVKSPNDLWKYTLLMSCSMFFGYLSMWLHLRKVVTFTKVSSHDIFFHLKPNLILVIPVFAISVYRQMDKVMLGSMATMAETGFYENAEKIIYALCGFITAFGTVMMPRITNMIAKGQEKESNKYLTLSMQFMMSLMFAMTFGLMSIADDLTIILFGIKFSGSSSLMKALSITIPFIGWANVIRSQVVIPRGKDKIFIVTVFSGAIINLIVNALLIPQMGAMGAVIGTICAEVSIPIVQFIILRKELDYIRLTKKCLFAPVCGGIMFVIVTFAKNIPLTGIKLLLIQITIGIIVYTILTSSYIFVFEKPLVDMLLLKRKSKNNNKETA